MFSLKYVAVRELLNEYANFSFQVIEKALFTHSQITVYRNRRDQTRMMVLSLPLPEGKIVGYESINKKLFSDVGFRSVDRLFRCIPLTVSMAER